MALLLEGATLFDAGSHWHAHESWEDLWNLLKKKQNLESALIVQGLIQTAALLYNHQRKNLRGVEKGWVKLEAKLRNIEFFEGIDVRAHLSNISEYHDDAGSWDLDSTDVKIAWSEYPKSS